MDKKTETLEYFDNIIKDCKELFLKKNKDYGPSWLMLRWSSLIDQIWIKAKRIRRLEESSDRKSIPEGREVEYMGIINYSIIALIRLWYKNELPNPDEIIEKGKIVKINEQKLSRFYDDVVNKVKNLLIKKNHDYGEAWRDMEIMSITDQIFVRLFRCKKILENDGLQVSEGLDAQFSDIINYAVFGLIKLKLYNHYSKKVHGIAVLIIDKKRKKILIVKRGNVKYFPNMWSIITGNISEGETPIDAAKREVKEELNISLTEKDLKYLGTFRDKFNTDHERVYSNLYGFVAMVNFKHINIQPRDPENVSVKLVDFREISKIKLPSIIKEIIYTAKKNGVLS